MLSHIRINHQCKLCERKLKNIKVLGRHYKITHKIAVDPHPFGSKFAMNLITSVFGCYKKTSVVVVIVVIVVVVVVVVSSSSITDAEPSQSRLG